MRACFCCNVFAMYFMWCICSTPKQARIQYRYLLLVPQAIPVFDPWQTEQQMIEAGNSYRQGIVTGQGMSDRHVSTHSWAGKNLLRYWIHSKRTRPYRKSIWHSSVSEFVSARFCGRQSCFVWVLLPWDLFVALLALLFLWQMGPLASSLI